MMRKLLICLSLLGMMSIGSASLGAAKTNRDIMKDYTTMHQSITWTVAGLYQLDHSSDSSLHLTRAEVQKILPVFEELITKKLIVLDEKDFPQQQQQNRRPSGSSSGNTSGNTNGTGNGNRGGSNDNARTALITKMTAETQYGNGKIDQMDSYLTKKQVAFIDNMDFDTEKYGYVDLSANFNRNSGQTGQTGQATQPRPSIDPSVIKTMRDKVQKGRVEQVKLNNMVYQLLKTKK